MAQRKHVARKAWPWEEEDPQLSSCLVGLVGLVGGCFLSQGGKPSLEQNSKSLEERELRMNAPSIKTIEFIHLPPI